MPVNINVDKSSCTTATIDLLPWFLLVSNWTIPLLRYLTCASLILGLVWEKSAWYSYTSVGKLVTFAIVRLFISVTSRVVLFSGAFIGQTVIWWISKLVSTICSQLRVTLNSFPSLLVCTTKFNGISSGSVGSCPLYAGALLISIFPFASKCFSLLSSLSISLPHVVNASSNLSYSTRLKSSTADCSLTVSRPAKSCRVIVDIPRSLLDDHTWPDFA